MAPPRSPPHASLPPPPDNAATAAWYRAGQALDAIKALEERVEEKMLLEYGQIGAKLRELKLANRRSGHDLREVQEELETSKVRQLNDALREALTENSTLKKKAEGHSKVWGNRIWGFLAALVLLVAGALLQRFLTGH